jgi:hypothetical protein
LNVAIKAIRALIPLADRKMRADLPKNSTTTLVCGTTRPIDMAFCFPEPGQLNHQCEFNALQSHHAQELDFATTGSSAGGSN